LTIGEYFAGKWVCFIIFLFFPNCSAVAFADGHIPPLFECDLLIEAKVEKPLSLL